MSMTITQALLLFAEYAPRYTEQCLDLVRHIELGDRELFGRKARSFLEAHLDEDAGFPEDVKTSIREAIGHDDDEQDLIPIKDYAAMHGINPATVRQRILRGAMRGAVKLAGSWFVPRDLPLIDNRRSGQSKRWKAEQGDG